VEALRAERRLLLPLVGLPQEMLAKPGRGLDLMVDCLVMSTYFNLVVFD
jgi:hypothetical protein